MTEIGHFLEVVDRRLAGATCRLVIASRSPVGPSAAEDVIAVSFPPWETPYGGHAKDASRVGCAAWINVDDDDQHAVASVRSSLSGRRLLIRPKEGIIWSPGAVEIREVFPDASGMTVKILASAPALRTTADQRLSTPA